MLDRNKFFCVNPQCPDYRRRGLGNVLKYGRYGRHKRQMLQCKTCRKTWSETRNAAFFHSRYSSETIEKIIRSVAEGRGIRETARNLNLSKDSVNRIVRVAGEHCRRVLDELLRDLRLEQCQLDELCSFVKKSRVTTGARKPALVELGSGLDYPPKDA